MTHLPSTPPTPPGTPGPKRPRPFSRPGILLLAIAAIALPACEEPWEEYRVVGYLQTEPEIPDTVTASVPVTITFSTHGGGCHRGGDTEVTVEARSALVTPYDFVKVGDISCTLIAEQFGHQATITFDEAGTSVITLRYSTGERYFPHHHDGAGRKVYTLEVVPAG